MSYSGRSVGRVLEFLSENWTTKAYNCSFDKGNIIYGNSKIGEYDWEENTDIPIFYFISRYEILNEQQYKHREHLIKMFGYIELDPEDKYLGTTGKYTKNIKGYL